MTMANEPADDTATMDDIFSTDRADRGGKEPASEPEATDGTARDERGRFAAKHEDEPPPVTQPEAHQQPTTAEQQTPVEPPPDQNANRHVPLSEMLTVRKRAQEAERQAQEFQAKYSALETLVQNLQRSQPAQQQRQPEPVEVPDPIVDPQGYINHHLSEIQAQQRTEMLDLYEDRIREKFGDEKVNTAFQLAQQTGALNQIRQARDPWSALMRWNSAYNVRQTVGDDLEAYNKRIADDAVAKALAGLKAGNAGQAPQRFPGTLAAATATGSQGAVLTDEAAMNDVFGSDRRSRRR